MNGRMGKAGNWLKSVYAWVRKWWQMFTGWLAGLCGEPERPDFSLCKTPEELKVKVDDYVARCEVWQERERKRLLADGRSGSAARPAGVFLAAVVTLCLLHWAYKSWVDPYQCCTGYLSLADWLDFFKGSTGAILLASPVAYVIWWFRDTNARQQIENQRKDTNLKDFQQLCQWASGEHLKTDDNRSGSMVVSHNPLQISAAHQLVPYLRGEFGSTFRRPAFKTLIAMWQSLHMDNLRSMQTIAEGEHLHLFGGFIGVTRAAVSEARGAFFYEHMFNTEYEDASGLVTSHFQKPALLLAGSRWKGTNLTRTQLINLEMQGAAFLKCNFEKASLFHVDMTGATFQACDLTDTKVSRDMRFDGATFDADTKWSKPGWVDPMEVLDPLTRELAIARGAKVLSATEGRAHFSQ